MNYSLSALSARIYPIVDFEVVGTLIYNGLSGFALKSFEVSFHRLIFYFYFLFIFKTKKGVLMHGV